MSTHVTDTPEEAILLVEDEVLVRMTLSRYLRECGYRVYEADTPAEAMMILDDFSIELSAVFIAMQFEQTHDAFSVARWVRDHRPGVDVILAGNLLSAAEKARTLCGKRPVPQTLTSEEIVREMRRMLATRAMPKKTETADAAGE